MDLRVLLFDAVAKGDKAALQLALDMGVNLLIADEKGYTALHWCAYSRAGEKLVPFLISRGAQMEATDCAGRTPLHVHVCAGCLFGASALLYHGAQVDTKERLMGMTPLHLSAMHNQPDIARALLAYGADKYILSTESKKPAEYGLVALLQ